EHFTFFFRVQQWTQFLREAPLLYAEEEGEVFLGRSVAKAKHMSDEHFTFFFRVQQWTQFLREAPLLYAE
ncbi:hypothetical protein PSZ95_24935, partial [Shigella sonnei]|nr:hypothetical protein [Shigella sonnei]